MAKQPYKSETEVRRLTVKLDIVDMTAWTTEAGEEYMSMAVSKELVCEAIEFTIRWILMTFPP